MPIACSLFASRVSLFYFVSFISFFFSPCSRFHLFRFDSHSFSLMFILFVSIIIHAHESLCMGYVICVFEYIKWDRNHSHRSLARFTTDEQIDLACIQLTSWISWLTSPVKLALTFYFTTRNDMCAQRFIQLWILKDLRFLFFCFSQFFFRWMCPVYRA